MAHLRGYSTTFTPIRQARIAGELLLGAYHRGQTYTFDQLASLPLEAGDVAIYLAAKHQ